MANRKMCNECNSPLKKDEVALSKKLLGLTITEFYCINCLATFLDCELDDLIIKIQEFKEQGCALFV